jgi:hypothetical protein
VGEQTCAGRSRNIHEQALMNQTYYIISYKGDSAACWNATLGCNVGKAATHKVGYYLQLYLWTFGVRYTTILVIHA